LQLRIFRKLRVTEDLILGEVPVLPGNACSQLPSVPLQGFSSTPTRFRYFFATGDLTFFQLGELLPLGENGYDQEQECNDQETQRDRPGDED
jgi:hypothetical protein